MKYLTIILLLISFNLSGQYNNDKYKVIGMSCLQTVTDAIGDGLMDSGHKDLKVTVKAIDSTQNAKVQYYLLIDKND